jgi:hypothetical protein
VPQRNKEFTGVNVKSISRVELAALYPIHQIAEGGHRDEHCLMWTRRVAKPDRVAKLSDLDTVAGFTTAGALLPRPSNPNGHAYSKIV